MNVIITKLEEKEKEKTAANCCQCDSWMSNDRIRHLDGENYGFCKFDHFIINGSCKACALFNKKEEE